MTRKRLSDVESDVKFNGPSGTLPPLDPQTEDYLNDLNRQVEDGLRKGELYRKTSKRKWGGNPLPGEPGSEKYFTTVPKK